MVKAESRLHLNGGVMFCECPYCGESFRHRQSLQNHLRYHRCPELSSTDDTAMPDLPNDSEDYAERLRDGFLLQSLGYDVPPDDEPSEIESEDG